MARKSLSRAANQLNGSRRNAKTSQGSAGYDNARENIDPHIRTGAVTSKEGTIQHTPTNAKDIVNKEYVDAKFPVTHASTTGQTTDDHHAEAHTLASHSTKNHAELTGVSADQHHNESHNVASHSDTSATGAELNTLTDNSVADALHRHSELVASDGSPDPALYADAAGNIYGTQNIIFQNDTSFTPTLTLNNFNDTDSSGPYIFLKKSRGTIASPSDVVNGDVLGSIQFKGQIGSLSKVGAIIQAFVDGAPGTKVPAKMRIRLNTATSFIIPLTLRASGNIGMGTESPAASAKLEIASTTGSLLIPRMTTVQMNALTAVNGMIIYDSTLNKFMFYENGAWVSGSGLA